VSLRCIFMGTPDFSVPTLARMIDDGHDVDLCVYSQPPRPAGRGMAERKSPVHQFAESRGIEVRTPVSLTRCRTSRQPSPRSTLMWQLSWPMA
jgi:methionyl-tRNA formyltransferase